MTKPTSEILILCMSVLMYQGCVLEEISEYGSRCEAAYVIDKSGTRCEFGACPGYDNALKNKFCPHDVPLCIQNEKGEFYCGVKCPKKYHPYQPDTEYASECELDTKEHCGKHDVNCLDKNDGWLDAICNSEQQCEATRCSDAYIHTGTDCLTAAECCGKFCKNCTLVTGRVCSGIEQESTCVSGCGEGYIQCQYACVDPMTSNTYCGSSEKCEYQPCGSGQKCEGGKCVCQAGMKPCGQNGSCVDVMTDESNCGACGEDCAKTSGWLSGKCIEGQCVPTICASNYHLDETVEGEKKCFPDKVEACGSAKVNCTTSVDGWISGRCEQGHCVPETCAEGLVPYVNYCVKPGSECGESVCGPHEVCEHNICTCEKGYERCNDDGICYDLMANNEHCGECGRRCDVQNANNQCVQGKCKFECHEGYIVDSDGESCRVRQCIEGEHRCSELTYEECKDDIWTEIDFCTTVVDNASAFCGESGCGYNCYENYTKCEDQLCYNLKTDVNHCGDCNKVCGGDHVIPKCENGGCVVECELGYTVKKDKTGCEPIICSDGEKKCTNLTPQICENNEWKAQPACTTSQANAEATCENGICGSKCKSGYEDCNGSCVNLQSDLNHCGSCAKVCNIANAINKCENGVCKFTCESGYVLSSDGKSCNFKNCDENTTRCSGTKIQTCTNNTWKDTTTCTVPTNGSATCSNSRCGITCNSGYKECSSGSCTSITTTSNCGGCGTKCDVSNATNSCVNNKCQFSCKSNYLQCGSGCTKKVVNGMVKSSTKAYTSTSGDGGKSVSKYSVYPIHGKSGSYYAVNYNDTKRYILKSSMWLLPLKGKVDSSSGVNVRSSAKVTSSNKVHGSGQGICWGCYVTIDNYEKGSDCDGGWYHITSNTGGSGPYKGYVCSDYISIVDDDQNGKASSLTTCN